MIFVGRLELPTGYCLFEKGNVSIVACEVYLEQLLELGIDNPNRVLEKRKNAKFFTGRKQLISIPLTENAGSKRIVIRQYAHGGFFRKITRDIFFTWLSRPIRELIVSEKAREKNIPTPKILAAITETIFFPFYKAYLITDEIPDSMDAQNYLKEVKNVDSHSRVRDKSYLIEKAAKVIRKMHEAGIYHADLNLKNILIGNLREGEKKIYLLDFDKAIVQKKLSERQKRRNLLRLNRSVNKFNRKELLLTNKDKLFFLNTYYFDYPDPRKILQKFI